MDMLAKYAQNELTNDEYILKYIQKNSTVRFQELVTQTKQSVFPLFCLAICTNPG